MKVKFVKEKGMNPNEILIRDEETGKIIFHKTKNSHCLYVYNEHGKDIYHEQLNITDLKEEGYSKDYIKKNKNKAFWYKKEWDGDELIRFENSDGFIQEDKRCLLPNGYVKPFPNNEDGEFIVPIDIKQDIVKKGTTHSEYWKYFPM